MPWTRICIPCEHDHVQSKHVPSVQRQKNTDKCLDDMGIMRWRGCATKTGLGHASAVAGVIWFVSDSDRGFKVRRERSQKLTTCAMRDVPSTSVIRLSPISACSHSKYGHREWLLYCPGVVQMSTFSFLYPRPLSTLLCRGLAPRMFVVSIFCWPENKEGEMGKLCLSRHTVPNPASCTRTSRIWNQNLKRTTNIETLPTCSEGEYRRDTKKGRRSERQRTRTRKGEEEQRKGACGFFFALKPHSSGSLRRVPNSAAQLTEILACTCRLDRKQSKLLQLCMLCAGFACLHLGGLPVPDASRTEPARPRSAEP